MTADCFVQTYNRARTELRRVIADAGPVIGCAALMATVGETVERLLKQDYETGECAMVQNETAPRRGRR
jgi:hypothetical protein